MLVVLLRGDGRNTANGDVSLDDADIIPSSLVLDHQSPEILLR